MNSMLVSIFKLFAGLLLVCFMNGIGSSFAGSDPISRTESNCNLGMVKGEEGRNCQVPIPAGCTVASFPGYNEPWADVSKGGRTTCRFDEQKTDWKTTIVGTCGQCMTDQCSARFSVMFNCAENIPPANPNSPGR